MESEITLRSFAVRKERGNRPGDFTTRFTATIELDNDASYYIGFNRIISMFFSWTNVNAGYNNQKITPLVTILEPREDSTSPRTPHFLILLILRR